VNLAAAGDALNLLLDSIDVYPATMVQDSAQTLFSATGITARDKAMAAFVIANTYFKLNDRTRGCDWVRQASRLAPSDPSYARFVQTQCL
jgi:hypothetical protein